MTPQEHRAAAERLLAEAEVYPPLVTVEGNLSAEDAQRIKDRIAEQIGKSPMVMPARIHIDMTGTMLAAIAHAVLSRDDAGRWAEGYGAGRDDEGMSLPVRSNPYGQEA